jgi:hypothetical protein
MKRTLCLICIGSLALGFTARGAQNNDEQTTTRKARKAQAVQNEAATNRGAVSNANQVRAHRNVTTAPVRQQTHVTSQTTSNAVVRESNLRNNRVRTFRERNLRDTDPMRARTDLSVNRDRNLRVNRERNLSVNAERNLTINRNRNVTVNNNWRGARFSGQQYAAFRNYHREWHDRNWWSSHHNRIVFVFGGPYYWDAGYWYPAWGYYPGYNYPYDGPIYGYNDLTPDQVVENVQSQLQREGYYAGPIDGVLGPMTRQAIAAFQADHGLAVTSTVDEPTVESLGLAS